LRDKRDSQVREKPKLTTPEPDLILYAKHSPAEIRQVHLTCKYTKRGELLGPTIQLLDGPAAAE
jgi:hypothetical protein